MTRSAAIAGKVLDSWAILSWLEGARPAAERVRRILDQAAEGRVDLRMSVINVGEVFYLLAKRAGAAEAEAFLKEFRGMPVKLVPAPPALVLDAARLKAEYPISYADAIAAQTAIRAGAPLVTGDPGFRRFIGGHLVPVEWIGG